MLGHYDPSHDYTGWLATVRAQKTAALVRDLNIDLGVAELLGAELLTRNPFRARALHRRPNPTPDEGGRRSAAGGAPRKVGGAVWASVPWLPDATPGLLIKVAANEARVGDLRRATAAAMRGVRDDDLAGQAAAVAELSNDSAATASRLRRDLGRSAAIELAAPAGLAAGSVLVAATFSPEVGLGAALASAATSVTPLRSLLNRRSRASYAFWMAHARAGSARR